MKKSTLSGYLFALVAGCGGGSGGANTCASIVTTPSDAGCATLCAAHGCPSSFCNEIPGDAGVVTLSCGQDHTGRRPTGLRHASSRARCVTGRYFANAAHLEAASVPAFRELADELHRFGAPVRLCRAAERSAREEVRHAEVMAQLAALHGASVPRVVVRPRPQRSLEAFARHNAVEGCVKETYGAAIAVHQSTHADDPSLRAAMATIATDEIRHAELAWQIDRWLASRLSAAARSRVERARCRAARTLCDRELATPDSAWASALGMPTAASRRMLVASLSETLWS